jgi:hypothetical protein
MIKLIKTLATIALWAVCFTTTMLLGSALSGCVHRSAAIEFNPSNSMCLDATVANMHAAGCHAVSVEKSIYGITEIKCHESKTGAADSRWINNKFIGIAFGTRIPEDVQPICTDPFMIMTVEEKKVEDTQNE